MRFLRSLSFLRNGPRIGSANIPVERTKTSDVEWHEFLSSKKMVSILNATKPSDLPDSASVWNKLYHDARKIWERLEADGLLDYLPTVYPVFCLFIKASFYFSASPKTARKLMFEDSPSNHILLALAAASSCPSSLARKVVELNKDQVAVIDSTSGQNPLDIVCHRTKDKCSNANGTSESLVQLFVEYNPEPACRSDSYGFFPLHRACQSGRTWETGVRALIQAAPHVVNVTCCHQSPFEMVALAHARETPSSFPLKKRSVKGKHSPKPLDSEVVTTLFELLICNPTVLSTFVWEEQS